MRFLKKLIKTNREIEGDTSLLIHSLVGCNLNCYGCHNKEELIDNFPTEYYSEEEIIINIANNGYFFDSIIFSGGEITLEKNLQLFLKKVREIYSGKIIIYTNGTNPSKIEEILEYVDGIFVDVKYNLEIEDNFNILGVNHYKDDIINTMNLVYKNNKGFSGFRTVKYPQYDEEYLKNMDTYIKNNYPNIKYSQNIFQY